MLILNIIFRVVRITPYFWDVSVTEVPNQALLYFPYIFLPAVIDPIIVFSHLASLYQLILKKNRTINYNENLNRFELFYCPNPMLFPMPDKPIWVDRPINRTFPTLN